MTAPIRPTPPRLIAAFGTLACGLAVALAAYAAHAPLEAVAKGRLEVAVFQLAVHALALCIFAPRQRRRLDIAALLSWMLGMALFCGSLVAAALWNASTALAPFGGMLLIAGWLLQTVVVLRR